MRLVGTVASPTGMKSPVSGADCAYYHSEIGATEELVLAKLRGANECHAFRPFAELRSHTDLVVVTDAGETVTLVAGHFLVRAEARARAGIPLRTIPAEIQALVGTRSSDPTHVSYREILLVRGDRVCFSGTIEPVMSEARVGYREAPVVMARMRPEREPVVVERSHAGRRFRASG